MAAQMSWSEALMAMIAMLIVLAFVLFYYCVWPIYTGFRKRKERERELYENDPRWDNAQFHFTPRIPKECVNDKKYSRLAACSRTSSMRSNAPILPPGTEQDGPCPPMYSELFETSSSLGTPPSYTSKTPSVENSSSNLLEQNQAQPQPQSSSSLSVPTKPAAKIRKNKKKPPVSPPSDSQPVNPEA